jgi:hypothetical protein
MAKNLFQGGFVLNADEKITVMGKLSTLGSDHPCCSACGADVDVSFLRKHHDTPIDKAVCLPCFLHNFTEETQEDIDRMVEIADSQGWYI